MKQCKYKKQQYAQKALRKRTIIQMQQIIT